MTHHVFHVYLRQSDRRWYPCVVLRDTQGLVAAHVAPKGTLASVLSLAEVIELHTFRGAERMRHQRVPIQGPVKGRWFTSTPSTPSYMLSRRDVPRPTLKSITFELLL
ncbi:MAG: hypothetical protein QM527_14380 [Alphaproteobacteria bacterium]|nr:hypothetical protein [Alphaproteobacteria bacterium]